jgi:hypothetical protein
MTGALQWLRAEVRGRWRAFVGLALLLGIVAGAVVAAAAGARRTDSAYDRFLASHDAADVILFDDGFLDLDIDLDAVEALPQVASVARGSLLYYLLTSLGGVASVDGRLGTTVNRFEVLDGRMYDPRAVDEIVVGFGVARRERLRVGSTFPLIDPRDLAELPADERQQYLDQNVRLRVVGIVAGAFEFPPQYAGSTASIHLTPAFFARYGNFQADTPGTAERRTLFIRLKRGAADVPAFLAAARGLAPGQFDAFTTATELSRLTERSFHFQALGLWLLAGFGALATILIFGQAFARQAFVGSTEFPTLSALGVRRGELLLIGLARAAIVGVLAGATAVGVAIALSPLSPVGDARIAEPAPGIAFDAAAISIGFGAVVLLSIAGCLRAAWRAARSATMLEPRLDARDRPSAVAVAAARTGMPLPIVVGTRLALEAGRGRTALPTRSTLAGLTVAIALLAGAITFGTSLNHLLRTPALYGVRWDAYLTSYGEGSDLRQHVNELRSLPGIEAIAIGTQDSVEVGGDTVAFYAIRHLRGRPTPPVVEGRAPRAPTEAVLGRRTLRRMRLGIGDEVQVRAPVEGARPITFTIVGRAVIPPSGLSEAAQGEGVLLNIAGYERMVRESDIPDEVPTGIEAAFITFSAGVDRREVIRPLAAIMGERSDPSNVVVDPETPADVVSFGGVRNLPLLLALIIGFIAASTLAHTIASSVRRRRGDLAILKTLGFVRRQVRQTVAWQATILVVFGAVIGIPAGVIFGRWLWTLFADQLGMVPEAAVDALAIALLAPAAVLLANAIAVLPGRFAAKVRPAVVLHTE